jgi:anion-transporting  ArsA/GET3 family ATPase
VKTLAGAVAHYRLLVCVGTGGVGKTTIAAALALDAALRGQRALVLTIDPARALARALGLAELGDETRVPADALAAAGLPPTAPLSVAMLDPKRAWDAFISRHAPSAAVAQSVFANPFYQRLSTQFAGSTEYMAIEELCRYAESGDYDVIVLDTPPSAHALDFVNAPERIDRLLDRDLAHWFATGAWRSAGFAARFLLRRLERATSATTLREIATFFVAMNALVDVTHARTRRVRALLAGSDAAFVLVAAPRQLVAHETRGLAAKLVAQPTPLAAVVVNRVHDVPMVAPDALAALGDAPPGRWLQQAWADAVAEATDEQAVIAQLGTQIVAPLARVAEAERDVHTLRDLAQIVDALRSHPSGTS